MSILFNPNDVIMIRHNYRLGTDQAFNILHYQIVSKSGALPGPLGILAEIAEAAFDAWSGLWAAGAAVAVTYESCSAQNISPAPRSRLATYVPEDPVPGVVVGDPMPLQDSITFLKLTDFGQRWGTGRVFYVGLSEGSQTEGLVTNIGTRAALSGLAESLNNNIDVLGTGWNMTLRPVLYHAPTLATVDKPATAERITPVLLAQVSDWVIKSMKTRRPGKGI